MDYNQFIRRNLVKIAIGVTVVGVASFILWKSMNVNRQQNENEEEETEMMNDKKDGQTYLYFGYGSNMSYSNFVKMKGMKPISMRRGIIENMKLSFSIQVTESKSCFANIEKSIGSQVHGCIYELNEDDMRKITELEPSYDRRVMTAKYYPQDIKKYNLSNTEAKVEIFICDKTTQIDERFAEFLTNNQGKPSKNYIQTIINGAKESKLYEIYIKKLENVEYIKLLQFNPSDDQWELINNKTFKMKQIEDKNNDFCVMKGIVFDISNTNEMFKKYCNNKDITFISTKRWAFYANNFQDIQSVDDIIRYDGLQEYMNHSLQELLNGNQQKVIGRLDDLEPRRLSSYKW